MAIPDFQTLMRPLLESVSDGRVHSVQEIREKLAERFKLTEQERKQLLPSGRQAIFVNRVAWAKVYLQAAGLLESPHRGLSKISDRGKTILPSAPERITARYLEQFPE